MFDGRSVYEVLSTVLDVGAFNELYVDDQDTNGLVLTARPAAWRNLAGLYIGGADATTVNLGSASLISESATRSDNGVANYFWVTRRADLVNEATRRLPGSVGPQESFLLTEEENSAPTAFGWRFMEQQTMLTNPDAAVQSPKGKGVQQRSVSEEAWYTERRRLLMEINRDNVVLESGSWRLRGQQREKRPLHGHRSRPCGERAGIDVPASPAD